ncbi:hypothetical protein UFOVP237_68 [uncultured Caudovirales phage]|uniref:Uncharacterized protein n=1 Tax=uncultured Caudovirales phage TaxID=2100421 RepID=A0A6J7WPZ3_9CAUD|nr:hypothetical protein UFOVP237_68 [uncultured Caudovirales phage]
MGVLDFLFQGSPPPSTTTYGTSTTGIPQFMSDYTQGLLSKANAVASEPYQAYGGQRLADFTQPQQQAFAGTQAMQGQYQPNINNALALTTEAGQVNPLGTAQSYLNTAAQSAPQVVGSYMNPYNDAVVNRIGQLAGRNLQENLMPNINSNFIRAGQFGSAPMQAAVGHALRDTQESALAAQADALNKGYGQAMTAAQTDLARQAGLGQTAGNLATQGAQTQLAAANQMGNTAQLGQTMGLRDLSALEATGQTQQTQDQKNLDLAYQDFLAQRQYPAQQLSMMNSLIRGLPYGTDTSTSATGPASSYQASPLSQIAGAASLGKAFNLFAEGGEVDTEKAKRDPNRRSTRGRKRK